MITRVTSAPDSLLFFNVLDPDLNFSDHLPLGATFKLHDSAIESSNLYLGLFFENRKNSGLTPGQNDDPVPRCPGDGR